MKKNIFIIIVCILAVGFMSGCMTTNFTKTGETLPPFKGKVKLLYSNSPDIQSIKFKEIGLVSANSQVGTQATLQLLLDTAASHGANAVIIDYSYLQQLTVNPRIILLGTAIYIIND